MGYDIRGRMQEICSCATFCPCWAGLDPDGGTCDFTWIFHLDTGQIDTIDVSGLSMGFVGHLPGNVFDGNVRLYVLVDDHADDAQQQALLAAFTGKHGGPLADLAALIGQVIGVERASFDFTVTQGSGTFRAGTVFSGETEGLRSPTGAPTMLQDAAVAPVLGSPAYPGKVVRFDLPDHAHGMTFTPRQATQAEFHHISA